MGKKATNGPKDTTTETTDKAVPAGVPVPAGVDTPTESFTRAATALRGLADKLDSIAEETDSFKRMHLLIDSMEELSATMAEIPGFGPRGVAW